MNNATEGPQQYRECVCVCFCVTERRGSDDLLQLSVANEKLSAPRGQDTHTLIVTQRNTPYIYARTVRQSYKHTR